MDLEKIIASVRAALDAKIAVARTKAAALNALRERIDGDTPPSDAELQAAITDRDAADREVDVLSQRLTELGTELERERALDKLQRENATHLVGAGSAAGGAPAEDRSRAWGDGHIGYEARTYAPHRERSWSQAREAFARKAKPGGRFERDVVLAFRGDPDAAERIRRHMTEERKDRDAAGTVGFLDRAVGTGAFAGLTIPQYLVEYYAMQPTNGRPFANAMNSHPLPSQGMQAFIGRVTTGTSVDDQASEGSAVSETDLDDTLITVPIRTAAGQQTSSIQAQARVEGSEDTVIGDLLRRYDANIDNKVLNVATDGLTNVSTAVTYTDATPTAAELYPKVLQAQSEAVGALLDMAGPQQVAVMHTRRWFWMQSQVGTSWPFIGQPGISAQQGGVNYAERYGSGFAGLLPNGTPVIVDNNVRTTVGAGTEDEIHLVDPLESHLWEDPAAPTFIRAEQTKAANLQVLLVAYGFYAFLHARIPHARTVRGTGLIAPVF